MNTVTYWRTTTSSPVGTLTVIGGDSGLRAVLWPDDRLSRVVVPEGVRRGSHPVVVDAVERLRDYFDGSDEGFDLPLDLVGTEFQLRVWRGLTDIAYGRTRSYAEHADAIGSPAAVRAVGAAIGRNPVSIVVPCHRVVGRDGRLTGFAGGLEAKRFLLDLEAGRSAPRLLDQI